ncbi:MAG: glycosyltransferase family 39 protein, partial [Deltaproteobacteria bacterium]|nr:glycosyltransferase family 39 protein [Deltaproteobacteria bacterium]
MNDPKSGGEEIQTKDLRFYIPVKKTFYYMRFKFALFIFIVMLTVFLRLHTIGEPLERDQTTYGYIAHRILAGEKLYTDLWDHKPPGIYWAYMLAESLWGYGQSGVVFIGIFFTLLSLVFLFLFLKDISGINTALVGSSFWALSSNAIFLQANEVNTELFLNTFAFISLWGFARYQRTDGNGSLFLAGTS